MDIPLSERSGISVCLEIYEEIIQPGYDLKNLSIRQEFLKRAVEEAGMTQAGAQTYYNACRRKFEGKSMYYTKPKEKKPKVDKSVQTFTEIAKELVASRNIELDLG